MKKPRHRITLRQKRIHILKRVQQALGENSLVVYRGHCVGWGERVKTEYKTLQYGVGGFHGERFSYQDMREHFGVTRFEVFSSRRDAIVHMTAKVRGAAHAIILKMKMSVD